MLHGHIGLPPESQKVDQNLALCKLLCRDGSRLDGVAELVSEEPQQLERPEAIPNAKLQSAYEVAAAQYRVDLEEERYHANFQGAGCVAYVRLATHHVGEYERGSVGDVSANSGEGLAVAKASTRTGDDKTYQVSRYSGALEPSMSENGDHCLEVVVPYAHRVLARDAQEKETTYVNNEAAEELRVAPMHQLTELGSVYVICRLCTDLGHR